MTYWLHRIANHEEISYPLLDRGCLSTGWSEVAADKERLAEMNKLAAAKDTDAARKIFERVYENAYGKESAYGKLSVSRYSLWRFLIEFKPGDCVLVPFWWGKFSLYKIVSDVFTAESLKLDNLTGENDHPLTLREDKIYSGKEVIDLGFFRKVEPIPGAMELSRIDDASAALASRMRVPRTNLNINDLAEEIERLIGPAKPDRKPSVYGEAMETMRNALLGALRSRLDPDPDKLKNLVIWYLQKCGADMQNPDKNAPDKKDGVDADITAVFENIKVVLYAQVKHHTGTASEWAVEQVSRYREQMENAGGEYHPIPWVLSTGDKFSDEAVRLAGINRVRLIDGHAFAAMLIDKGLQNIDEAF